MKSLCSCIFCVMLFFANNMMGQSTAPVLDGSSDLKKSPPLSFQRLHVSLDVGAGYMGGSGYNSGAFTTIAPSLNYTVSPKLKFEVGSVILSGNHSFYQMPATETQPSMNQRSTQALVYAQGQYLLTDRLMLTGSVYKTMNSNALTRNNPYSLDYKGMNIGLDYKIAKNISIGAQFRYSNGNQNYMLNQNGMGLYSPYQQNAFGW